MTQVVVVPGAALRYGQQLGERSDTVNGSTSNGIAGLAAVAVDSADPRALAGFWQRLVGGRAVDDEDGDTMLSGGLVDIIFMRVPGPKAGKNRVHLDLRAADHDAAVAFAREAGATLANDIYQGPRWQVLRDPEGNEFCILPPRS